MKATILTIAMATAAFVAAAPASAQLVGYDTTGSTFSCGSNALCSGSGTNAVNIGGVGGMNLTFGAASGLVTAPSAIGLGTVTTSGTSTSPVTLDGITLDILVNSLPGGPGTLPGGDIMGTLSGTSSNAQITWSAGGVQLGSFIYTVTNSPLSLVPPTVNNGLGLGTTSIQGWVAAVPEPATWAMMLLGFGAIGLTMRSRRRPALAQVA